MPKPQQKCNLHPSKTAIKTPNLEGLESRTLLSATPTGLTPAEVRSAYGFNLIDFTNSSGQTIQGNGAGQTIAIVDPYVSSTITADLNKFDQTFDDSATQTLYSQYGAASTFFDPINLASKAVSDAGWALETALDVEWAHAIAPAAKIDLIEAVSPDTTDLLNAVSYAAKLSGVSVVSMSWGGSEFSGENTLDSYFTTPAGHQGVTFVAAAGDTAANVSWPAVSDNVVAVGGTSLKISSSGAYLSETAWNSSGGGLSSLEAEPSYQSSVNTTGLRATPDVGYDADPNTGFSVYTATPQNGQTGWITVGGTSAGAPQWSALIAIADQGRVLAGKTTLDGPTQTLPTIYGLPATDFHDVTSGSAGQNQASSGYDLVTGRGSPVANSLVAGLVASTTTTPMGTVSATPTSGGSSNTGGTGGSNGNGNGSGSGGRDHRWPPPPPPPRFGRGWSNQPPFRGGRYAITDTLTPTDPALAASASKSADSAPATSALNALDDATPATQSAAAVPSAQPLTAPNLTMATLWSQTPIIAVDAPSQVAQTAAGATATTDFQPTASPANEALPQAPALNLTVVRATASRVSATPAKAIAVGAFPPGHITRLPIAIAEALLLVLVAKRKQKPTAEPVPVKAD